MLPLRLGERSPAPSPMVAAVPSRLVDLLFQAASRSPDAVFHRNYPFAIASVTEPGTFHFDGLSLDAPAGVYSPASYGSSRFVADRWGMAGLDVVRGRLLDLGCGSGVLGLIAARQGWTVSAGDINPVAVDAARRNAAHNGLPLDVRESDLFSAFQGERFEAIVFNLPFFHKASVNPDEIALADVNGQLAQRFLDEAGSYLTRDGAVVFTFSNCSDPAILDTPGWTIGLAGCDYDPRGHCWRALMVGRPDLAA